MAPTAHRLTPSAASPRPNSRKAVITSSVPAVMQPSPAISQIAEGAVSAVVRSPTLPSCVKVEFTAVSLSRFALRVARRQPERYHAAVNSWLPFEVIHDVTYH